MVEAEPLVGDQVSKERGYYIMSLLGKDFGRAVRSYWGIKNGLQWALDLAFQEDDGCMRKDHSQQNRLVVRHMTINLLELEQTAPCFIEARRLKAGWTEVYFRTVLAV